MYRSKIELTYDWATYISTGPGIGNIYEILGDQDTYTLDIRRNQPEPNPDPLGRERIEVGKVALDQLDWLETYLARVPIRRHDPNWYPNHWVWDVLCDLRERGFAIDRTLRQWYLERHMLRELRAELRKETAFLLRHMGG
ncbi:hypothetical protein EDB19DRAFT_1829817 [Suillus lakei]|nr:hypothetical protein EDB19DRAFT_1829817 [Suillus lakei]